MWSTFVHLRMDVGFFLALTTSWNTNSTMAPATSARKMISTMMKNCKEGGEKIRMDAKGHGPFAGYE